MNEKDSRRIIAWILVFLYFGFLYNYGAKLSTLQYTDFPSFYYGAKLTFVQHQSPYDEAALKAAAEKSEPIKPGEAPPTIYPYLYPPPSLLMFYPLARLNVEQAKVALLIANHICLLAVVGMLLVPIAGFKPQELLTVLPACLMIYLVFSKGTFNTIELGQVNLVILVLLCLAWWGFKRDWPAWAIALPLGVACVFKIYPVLFLALLVLRRKWGTAILTVTVLVGVCGIAWLTLPKPLWHQWTQDVLPTGGYLGSPLGVFPPTISQNIGLAGFTSRIFLTPQLFKGHPPVGEALFPNAHLGRLLTYGLVAIIVLITTGVAYISSRKTSALPAERDHRINLEFSAFLILTFLAAPLAWEHHLVYVTPAVMIAILALVRVNRSHRRALSGILLIACILGWPLSIGKLPLPKIPQILAVSLKFYAVLALWIFLLREMVRTREIASIKQSDVQTSSLA